MSNNTFMERVLAGDVLDLDEIDDDIDAWHDTPNPSQPLHDWLGMTELEYSLFVEKPEFLNAIIQARKYGMNVTDYIKATQNSTALAARGADPKELALLTNWLRTTGRI